MAVRQSEVSVPPPMKRGWRRKAPISEMNLCLSANLLCCSLSQKRGKEGEASNARYIGITLAWIAWPPFSEPVYEECEQRDEPCRAGDQRQESEL